MSRHDSAERPETEPGEPDPPAACPPIGLVRDPAVSQEDLVAFLDQNLDADKTQLILHRIGTDPTLRHQAVSLQSTWDLLDLLPPEQPGTKAADQAARVLQTEARRNWWRGTGLKIAALLLSLISSSSGWLLGTSALRPGRLALADSIYQVHFRELLLVAGDIDCFGLLLNHDQSAIFAKLCRLNPADDSSVYGQLTAFPSDERGWERLERDRRQFDSLPASHQSALVAMAKQIQALPAADRLQMLQKLTGLRVVYDSMPDDERQRFDQLSGQTRWLRAVKGAELLVRQMEGNRKQAFTVTELNRPDFIMDLATLTAQWMKMTPQEKNAFERRSRNMKSAPQSKTDRLRQLAQSLENLPDGSFPALEALKNNPPPRLANKLETLKQQREKKRNEYLEAIRRASPVITDPSALQTFQANLPPWLVDLIDPLPPSEARRLLGILKVLVDQNAAAASSRTNAKNKAF